MATFTILKGNQVKLLIIGNDSFLRTMNGNITDPATSYVDDSGNSVIPDAIMEKTAEHETAITEKYGLSGITDNLGNYYTPVV